MLSITVVIFRKKWSSDTELLSMAMQHNPSCSIQEGLKESKDLYSTLLKFIPDVLGMLVQRQVEMFE